MTEDEILRQWNNTRFLTVPCSQSAVDFILWEHVLNKHCQKGSRILELGTLRGGFSLFLCLQATQRGMEFKTFDNYDFKKFCEDNRDNTKDPYGFNTPLGKLLLKDCFVEEDVLHVGTQLRFSIVQPGQTILFCDNGLKPLEVKTYNPYLKPGDILAVHDWNTEVFQSDIPISLKQIEVEMTECLRGMTAFFVKE